MKIITRNKFINLPSTLLRKFIVLVILLCSPSYLLTTTYAQDTDSVQIQVASNILSGEALGEFKPYEPESGNILARDQEFFQSNNGQYAAGIWEGKPGTMTIENAPYAEVMYIVEGSMAMNAPESSPITYNAGEGVIMPKG